MSTVHIQPMTGVVDLTADCSVAGRSRYGTEPAELTTEVREALASGLYRWCKKCGG